MDSNNWQKAKAEQMLLREIGIIGRSNYPQADTAEGMIQLAYALDLLTDHGMTYWQDRARVAVRTRRRQELRDGEVNHG